MDEAGLWPQDAESLMRDADTPPMGSHGGNSSDGKGQKSPKACRGLPTPEWAGESRNGVGPGEKALLEGRASQLSL